LLVNLRNKQRSSMARQSRSTIVQWQFEPWDFEQLHLPIPQLIEHNFCARALPLPSGVVGIPDRQLREARSVTGVITVIQVKELSLEDSHRPAIAGNMMHRRH